MHVKLSSIRVFLPAGTHPLFEIKELEIPSGERVLIQGPSGRGKTTLLHLIAGLFMPTDGYIFIDGKNLRFLSEEERCRLRRTSFGVVFQKLNLVDHLTALENVLLTLPPDRNESEASDCLKRVGVDGLADTRAAVLSLGEQQRVAVARVLASRPKLILADEPTSSLDDKNAEAVITGLLEAGEKATLIAVSHDHRLVPHFKNVLSFDDLVHA